MAEGLFDHLELNGNLPAAPKAKAEIGILCRHCGQANEKEREACWACCELLVPKTPAPEVTLVVNGQTFRQSDPDLPEDIAGLFKRIKKEGYSPRLLEDWRRARETPKEAPPDVGEGAVSANLRKDGLDVEVMEGRRCQFIRIDGKTFSSDDQDLPEELKLFFSYIKEKGVTPRLMDQVRRYARQAKAQENA